VNPASAQGQIQAIWPLASFVLLTVGTFASMLAASAVLGERRSRAGAQPYESGMVPTGDARVRFAPQFYVVGLLFVLFDVEAAFLYPWAVAVRRAGWSGFAEAAVFVGVLLASLVWLVRVGALSWGGRERKIRHQPPPPVGQGG
jgi:NADH-quinone oxidoreductase subunit A